MDSTTVDLKIASRTTLLLVDDDTQQLELWAQILMMSGFTVVTAGSPAEAISVMARRGVPAVDVAILDYAMPLMNGCVLADYLKRRYPHLN
jgi:DNA-binding NtrC family response regulator